MRGRVERSRQMNAMEVSVVVPVYNEEKNLPILVPRLAHVLEGIGCPYEMIFVDDGSTDRSREILKEMARRYATLRLLGLKDNRGLSTALLAGMREARNDVIVTLDSDLQNDPADIPRLLQHLDRHDMATGWRQKRDDPWLKKVSSKIGNAIRNRVSGEAIHDSACTLRVFKKECVRNVPVFNGMHRFLPTLAKMEGFTATQVKVNHRPRRFGKTKYNIRNRMVRAFADLLAVRWMKKRHLTYDVKETIR